MKKALLFFTLLFLNLCTLQGYEYTVNLMWINRKLNEKQRYIYPASNEDELSKKFLRQIFKWAVVSQNSIIHLWYDSVLTPAIAVKNTQQLITDYVNAHPKMAPIVLRDVRELPSVIKNPEIFSDKTPIFFRVDLLRVIAQEHDITTEITPYFVYSDLDVNPLSQEEIFDEETCSKLKTFGIVMAYHPMWQGFENSFSIVSNHNQLLLEAMRYAMIELNIQRGYHALQGRFYKSMHLSKIMPLMEQYHGTQQDDTTKKQQLFTASQNYSINIMWINERFKENQQFIHPGLNEEELLEHFFQPFFQWATMNPEGIVNLWFDSAVTPAQAVKNTALLIQDLRPEISNIVLRDIRSLPYVQEHPEIFSKKTPSNFQEALLGTIAALFDISTGHTEYCVYGDLLDLAEYKDLFGLKDLSAKELFNEQSMKDLQNFGITSSHQGGLTKEIIGGNTQPLFKILTDNWLKQNIEKAYSMLYGKNCCKTCCASTSELQQIIYSSYSNMFKYFYHHAGFGKLFIENFDHLVKQFTIHEYDKNKDGLIPFGFDRLAGGGYFEAGEQLPEAGIGRIWIPTKKIAHPAPTLIYEDEAPTRCIFS